MTKRLSIIIAAIMLFVTIAPITGLAVDLETVEITEDGTYTISESVQAVTIDGADATVILHNADIEGSGRSAVFVKGNSDVIFRLEGSSTVKGDANTPSAGIEIELGSRVIFEGEGNLYVEGGKYGAGIGSYGTGINIPEEERRNVGEIIINSGNIVAKGGARGAGIGSGYHVNGNFIEINGGKVTAYGTECGAGIGSGYGTSGGAIGVAAVGEYDSGRIHITGGEVYAAAFYIEDFNAINDLDTDALNAMDKSTFAAGIGGGYGASASDILIEGGKVFAVGSCGGAGIGAGRGTSKAAKYNQDAYRANITIKGDAEVTAIALDDTRNYNGGGAAIGSGRGSHTGGNITITDSANVRAIAASKASAIGAGAEKSPVDGTMPSAESISITSGVTLYALSTGRVAVDQQAPSFFVADTIGHNDEIPYSEDTQVVTLSIVDYVVPTKSVSLWANIRAKDSDDNGDDNQDIADVKEGNGLIRIDAPLKMAVAFGDGTVYYGGEMKEVEFGKEYPFQMCSVNWDNGLYDEDGNGLRGSVVYRMIVVHRDEFNELAKDARENPDRYLVKGIDIIDNDNKTIIIDGDAEDTHLETDVNSFFMAYRFHFTGEDYGKKTGIANVINTPVESLSVNLPLGSTISCDAYINGVKVDSRDIFITNNSGEGEYENEYLTSVNDYTWEL